VGDDSRPLDATPGGSRVGDHPHEGRSSPSLEGQMNPFHWTRQHRMAWLIVSLTGAVAAVLFAYIQSPFFFAAQGWQVFEAWLWSPGIYWVWPISGFFVTALHFYLAQLARTSN
jgi:hypothetical protein